MADREIEGREQLLSFGPFQLVRSRKLLLQSGRPVRLGSRAIDVRVALVERAGEVVGKNELLAHVWPATIVEESKRRGLLTALRPCLGAGQPGARFCDAAARALIRPLLLWAADEPRPSNMRSSWPVLRSCSAGAAPRGGRGVV